MQTLTYLMPSEMKFHVNPTSSTPEGKPFSDSPQLRIHADDGQWVQNLGTEMDPWIVEATLVSGAGADASAKLVGETRVSSKDGTFNFTDLSISHQGSGYTIRFAIVHPAGAAPAPVTTGALSVTARPVTYTVDWTINTVYQYAPVRQVPTITVRDQSDNAVVNTGYADRKWWFKVHFPLCLVHS